MVDSIEFAKYVISRIQDINTRRENPITLGETKLQKLVYICSGFMLAFGIDFIKENARAWNYGPVFPRIHRWASKYNDLLNQNEPCLQNTLEEIENIQAQPLIDSVIETYGLETAQTLSLWTHKPGGPWEKALERGKGVMNSVIDKDDIRRYFKELLGESA
jgi:uncharacterized phage-associated protein